MNAQTMYSVYPLPGAAPVCRIGMAVLLTIAGVTPSVAQTPIELGALRQQIDAIRTEQAQRIEKIEQETAQRIKAVEDAIAQMESMARHTVPPQNAPVPVATIAPVAPTPSALPSRPQFSGDLRLRFEATGSEGALSARHRAVMRGRLRGAYKVADGVTVAAQLSTGDPDDPNTTDVTLGSWNDDFLVSLDQVYADFAFGNLHVYAGKFPNPFVRTSDIVWDGDVSIAGIGIVHKAALTDTVSLRLAGAYFAIDERAGGSDSNMIGAQIALDSRVTDGLRIEGGGAYYRYGLRSLVGADAGDIRSNRLGSNGLYLSDFDLVDVHGAVTYGADNARWPLRLSGNYVVNLGAADKADTGYSVDLSWGRLAVPHDWRVALGYSAVETDAVLAAFSHDNFDIATNYQAYSLSTEYLLRRNITLNATLYRYRPLAVGNGLPVRDWRERLRLNMLFAF